MEIPYGYCHCGCGQMTRVPRTNDKSHGYVAGQPLKFVRFHARTIVAAEECAPFKIDGVYCRLIPLGKSLYAIVDATDYQWLMRWKWYYWFHPRRKIYYAVRDDHKKRIYLHRQITNAPTGVHVDHQNRNTLDYRRDNLRVATSTQNQCNRAPQHNNKSGYKGVHWRKDIQKWQARIAFQGKTYHLGVFDTAEEAARAYDAAAIRLHGEFAWLNFPPEPRRAA